MMRQGADIAFGRDPVRLNGGPIVRLEWETGGSRRAFQERGDLVFAFAPVQRAGAVDQRAARFCMQKRAIEQ